MGGGGKGKTEYQVAEYYLTLDYGLCHGPLDSINEIWVKEQIVWSGYIGDNSTLYLSDKEAFGGKKKEGGVHGSIDVYMGTDTQTMTGPSAVRYGQTALAMPGYRGSRTWSSGGQRTGKSRRSRPGRAYSASFSMPSSRY